ncbi:hypothetical protein [Halobacillus amylolyticus]|uniref:Uncharacterized protein n=1 Tax=Halobacillus amylolyticus TaxID=2932259 RepID=A0ABY4HEX5_9BACI|nr:hypothetical protein [Halobacillus amylolyticus]UOR13289.1 hypothetical protein MUO15_07325 [Halobacillus amylolyticus]
MNSKICRYCYKEIRDRDELVTASNWFRVRPYHYRCFEKIEEETRTIAGTWTPINGRSGLITVILMLALSLWMITTNTLGQIGDLIGLLALYPVVLRIVSYVFIESRLPKFIKNKKHQ